MKHLAKVRRDVSRWLTSHVIYDRTCSGCGESAIEVGDLTRCRLTTWAFRTREVELCAHCLHVLETYHTWVANHTDVILIERIPLTVEEISFEASAAVLAEQEAAEARVLAEAMTAHVDTPVDVGGGFMRFGDLAMAVAS